MNRNHLERCHEMVDPREKLKIDENYAYVSLETEIPEVLYNGMNEFIVNHPNWDKYQVLSSALAHFLFQNGCDDCIVTETYLSDLFTSPDN